ncbi:MAG: hypothetical protein ACYCYF_14900 [Anaerolineae bacterium]
MRNRFALLLGIALVALALAACGVTATAGQAAGLRPITIEGLSVKVGVGSPIPVDVVVSATWPDLCAQIARIDMSVDGTNIDIELLATAEAEGCPPDYVGAPMRIAIPLNGIELPPGNYRVTVNNSSTGFTWPATP